MLRAEFHLPSITAEEATPERKAPIRVKFEIPYFTVSGIQVSLALDTTLFLHVLHFKLVLARKLSMYYIGSVPEDNREEWVPSTSVGEIHNHGW